jgi:hypothetical protein
MFFLDSLNSKFARYLSFPVYVARGLAAKIIAARHQIIWSDAHFIHINVKKLIRSHVTIRHGLYYVESSTEDYMEKWSPSMQNCACYAHALGDNSVYFRSARIETSVRYFAEKNRPRVNSQYIADSPRPRLFSFHFNSARSGNERITNYYLSNSIWILNKYTADGDEFIGADLFISLCACLFNNCCINCLTFKKNIKRDDQLREFYLNNSLRSDFYDGNVFDHMIKKLNH